MFGDCPKCNVPLYEIKRKKEANEANESIKFMNEGKCIKCGHVDYVVELEK